MPAAPVKSKKPDATPAEPTVHVADAGPCRKKLTITLPSSAIEAELSGQFRTLASQATLPGFRRGHAPQKLIERMFGQAARDETKQRLVSAAFQKAVQDNSLKVIGDIEGGEDLRSADFAGGKDMTVTVEVEVAPEFALPALDGITIKRPVYAVTPEAIEEEVQKLCVHEGDLQERESAEPGDYCTGKGVIKDASGKVMLEIDGAVIQVPTPDKGGKGAILGVLVDDFGKQVGKPKAGATIKVKATGPESHETVGIRGKPIDIEFAVSRVDRIVPATVEAVCAKVGAPTEEALRDALASRLAQRNAVRQQAHLRRQISERLLAGTTMDLPERLSDNQAARNLERRRMELMYRGFNPVQVEEQIAEMRAASAETARKELKLFFILEKVARDLDVQASEGEINQRIGQIAAERGVRADRLRAELIQQRQVGVLIQQIREHKAMDALVGKAKAEDVPGEEFEKQQGRA